MVTSSNFIRQLFTIPHGPGVVKVARRLRCTFIRTTKSAKIHDTKKKKDALLAPHRKVLDIQGPGNQKICKDASGYKDEAGDWPAATAA
jgi:hypothetical protein